MNFHIVSRSFLAIATISFCSVAAKSAPSPASNDAATGSNNLTQGNIGQNIITVEEKSSNSLTKAQQDAKNAAGLLDPSSPLDLNDIKTERKITKDAAHNKHSYHQDKQLLTQDQQQADQDISNAKQSQTTANTAKQNAYRKKELLINNDKQTKTNVVTSLADFNSSLPVASNIATCNTRLDAQATLLAPGTVTPLQDALSTQANDLKAITSAKRALKDQKRVDRAFNLVNESLNTQIAAVNATLNTFANKDQLDQLVSQYNDLVQQANIDANQLAQDKQTLDANTDRTQTRRLQDKYDADVTTWDNDDKAATKNFNESEKNNPDFTNYDDAFNKKALLEKNQNEINSIVTSTEGTDLDSKKEDLKQAVKDHNDAHEKKLAKLAAAKAHYQTKKADYLSSKEAVATAKQEKTDLATAKQCIKANWLNSKEQFSNANDYYNQWATKFSDAYTDSIKNLQAGIDSITTVIANNTATVAADASLISKKGKSAIGKMQRLATKINNFLTSNPSFNSQDVVAMNKAIAKDNFHAKKEFHQANKLAQQDQQQAAQDVQQAQLILNNVHVTLDPIHQVTKSLEKEDQHAKKAVTAAEQNIISPDSTGGEMSVASISTDKNQKKLDHDIAKEQQIAGEEATAKTYYQQAKIVKNNAKVALKSANAEMQAANNEKSSLEEDRTQLKLVSGDTTKNITAHIQTNGSYYDKHDGILYYTFYNTDDDPTLFAKRNANIAGALVTTFADGKPQFGSQYAMISAPNVHGNFSNIVMPEGMRGRMILVGDPIVELEVAPQSYTQVAVNQNQFNVARALDTYIPARGGDELTVSEALDSLTATQYQAAFNQIMPALYSSFATIAFNIENAQNNAWIQRLGGLRVGGSGFSQEGFKDSPLLNDDKKQASGEKDILIPSADNHWRTFVEGNGVFATIDNSNQLPGYSAESGGVTLGADYNWSDSFATGVYTGYQGMQSKQSGGNFICDNSSRFGLFSTYQQGGWFANAVLGGDTHSYQVNRTIQFADISRTAASAPTAGELNSMLVTGYDVKKGNFTFGPVSSLQYTYFGLQPFTETGAQALDLSVGNANANSLIYTLGTHAFYTWQVSKDLLLVPQVNLSWQHEFLQNPYALNAALPNGANFTYMTATSFRDSLYTGVGMTMEFAKKYNASVFYNASAGNPSLMSQNIFVSLGMKF